MLPAPNCLRCSCSCASPGPVQTGLGSSQSTSSSSRGLWHKPGFRTPYRDVDRGISAFLWAGGRGQQDGWLGNKVPAAPGLCQRDPRQTALQCTLTTCTALSWGCSGFPAPSAKHWSTGEPGVAWHAFTQCWVLLLLLPLVGGLHCTTVTLRRTALEPWAPKCCRSGLYPSAHPQ